MNQTTPETRSFPRIVSTIALAFLLIKASIALIPDNLMRHICVAFVLIILPVLSSRRSASFFSEIFRLPKNNWGYFICMAYVILPILAVLALYPEQSARALVETRNWVLSAPGFASIVIAPVAEEFFFRGWLLNYQLHRLGHRVSPESSLLTAKSFFWLCYFNALCFWILHIPVSSEFFSQWAQALQHGAVPVSPGPFFLGFAATALTLFTGTPLAALFIHALANSLGPLWLPLLRESQMFNYFYQ